MTLLLESFFDSSRSDAPAVFFVTYTEFYMKMIIISFLLTVIVFLFAAFVAVLFRVSSFKNEDDGEGV